MPTPPPSPAAERFAAILRWLGRAVAAQSGWGLSSAVIALIIGRLERVRQRFARLAARIAAGTYTPRRRATAPDAARLRPPPPRNPLPNQPGWLLPLEKSATCHRAAVEQLFAEAEMVALMAAAPEAMARVLRPLCRMLALDLPPVLRRKPARADASEPASAAAARPKAPSRRRAHSPPPPPPHAVPAPPPALTLEFAFGRPRLVWN